MPMSLILDTAKISLTCEGDFEYQFDGIASVGWGGEGGEESEGVEAYLHRHVYHFGVCNRPC